MLCMVSAAEAGSMLASTPCSGTASASNKTRSETKRARMTAL
jgi:hypothetical protein